MGFNSEYVNNQVSIVDEGTYAVVNDAHTVHPNFFCNEDHTSGNGKFMAVNGAGVPNVKVWYLTLDNVEPGVRYEFSTWITSLHETNPATLQFSINGELMGEPFQAYPYTCDWYQFFHIWDSETNDQAIISIVNQNTILSGNDFALDDISFATVLVYYDTVYVEVLPQFNSSFISPTSACAQEAIIVAYTGNAPDTADFHWDFGSATVLSGNGPGPYEIVHNSMGNNTISLWVGGDGCASDTTYQFLTIGESPLVTVYADNTILPYGSSTTLHGSYSGGTGPFEYEWAPPGLLADPGSLDPQTIALEYTTTFILAVTDLSADCTGFDTIVIEVAGGPLGVSLLATPGVICQGGQSVLAAQGLGGTENYIYSWTSFPPGFTSDLPTVTVQPLINTDYTVTVDDGLSLAIESVTVTVHANPATYAGADQIIAYGTNTVLQGTASGGSGSYVYQWEPAALVVNPGASSTQTVNLESTTIFTLIVTDQVTGCTGESDEIIVHIEGGPLAVIINCNKTDICEGDSAVLTAYASGGNPGSYTYAWSDNLGNTYPANREITVSPSVTTVFHVVVDDGFNAEETYDTLVVFHSAEFGWEGGIQSIMACPEDNVTLIPDPHPATWNYLWSNGSTDDRITVGATGIGFSLQTYGLTTTTPDGCSFSGSIQVIFDFSYCSGTGEEQEGHSVRILPNPNMGRFNIELDEPSNFRKITLYSMVSGMIFTTTIPGSDHEFEINLPELPAGLYLLYLEGPGIQASHKVIISH
jgi:hypothetical protein